MENAEKFRESLGERRKMKKIPLFGEISYTVGLILLALGTAFIEKADFGMSMVVAPAYVIHVFLSDTLPFFSFGMSGYVLQGVMLIPLIIILRRPRLGYLFSFVTAVIYGFMLDGAIFLCSPLPSEGIFIRIVLFVIGLTVCAAGIALFMRSYIPPVVYDLTVKEISLRYSLPLFKVKTVYDLSSLIFAVVLSFAFFGFGSFVGVGVGTLITAVLNGPLIGAFTALYSKFFEDRALLPIVGYFE